MVDDSHTSVGPILSWLRKPLSTQHCHHCIAYLLVPWLSKKSWTMSHFHLGEKTMRVILRTQQPLWGDMCPYIHPLLYHVRQVPDQTTVRITTAMASCYFLQCLCAHDNIPKASMCSAISTFPLSSIHHDHCLLMTAEGKGSTTAQDIVPCSCL